MAILIDVGYVTETSFILSTKISLLAPTNFDVLKILKL